MADVASLDSARSFVTQSITDKNVPQEKLAALVVGLAWTRQHPEALQPGRTVIHPTCARTGEIKNLHGALVEVDFAGELRSVAASEIASTFAYRLASEKLELVGGSEELALARIEVETPVIVQG